MGIHGVFEGTCIFTRGKIDGRMSTCVIEVWIFGSDGYILILSSDVVVNFAITIARAGGIGTLKVGI